MKDLTKTNPVIYILFFVLFFIFDCVIRSISDSQPISSHFLYPTQPELFIRLFFAISFSYSAVLYIRLLRVYRKYINELKERSEVLESLTSHSIFWTNENFQIIKMNAAASAKFQDLIEEPITLLFPSLTKDQLQQIQNTLKTQKEYTSILEVRGLGKKYVTFNQTQNGEKKYVIIVCHLVSVDS